MFCETILKGLEKSFSTTIDSLLQHLPLQKSLTAGQNRSDNGELFHLI